MHFFCLGVFPHLFHQSTPWNEVNTALAFSLEQALNQHGLVRRVDMKHTLLCSCEVREGMIKKKKWTPSKSGYRLSILTLKRQRTFLEGEGDSIIYLCCHSMPVSCQNVTADSSRNKSPSCWKCFLRPATLTHCALKVVLHFSYFHDRWASTLVKQCQCQTTSIPNWQNIIVTLKDPQVMLKKLLCPSKRIIPTL